MDAIDFANGWHRLQQIYTNMAELTPALQREWSRVGKEFTAEEWNTAIGNWIENERYRPIPVDMIKYCHAARQQMRRAQQEADLRRNGVCRYCNGGGSIIIRGYGIHAGKPYDAAMPCNCAMSYDRERGETMLAQALSDPKWVLDKSGETPCFRRRTEWIGEEKEQKEPATAGEYAALKNASRSLFSGF